MTICSRHTRKLWIAATALEVGLAIAIAALATLGDCDTPTRNYP